MVNDQIDLVVVPVDEDIDVTSRMWPIEMRALVIALGEDAEIRPSRAVPAPGHKGGAGLEVVVSLGSSGAIAGVVTVLRQWLGQRASRKVSLRIDGPTPVTVELDADGLSDATVREILAQALEQARDA